MDVLERGTHVDRFIIKELLYSAGGAYLYEVETKEINTPLIMKIPKLGPSQPVFGLVSFEMECSILPVLKGSHVPRFIAANPLAIQPYVVMEKVIGEPLINWVKPLGLSLEKLQLLGIAIANAAHSLHRQDTIHLDIKPDNLIIKENNEVVFIDFGFAHHSLLPDLFADNPRQAIGSTPYIAPEQIEHIRLDPRSDQFAIGVTLYQLATGELPFGIPVTLKELRQRHWLRPTPIRHLRPDLPEWLQEIIFTCLEPLAEKRFASTALLARAFADPESIMITERGRRSRPDSMWARLIKGFRPAIEVSPVPQYSPSEQVSNVPLIAVLIDLEDHHPERIKALRYAVLRAMERHPDSHLSALNIIEVPLEGAQESGAAERHHKHRILLEHWLRQLHIPKERCSAHVIETTDIAQKTIDFAKNNYVDVIIVLANQESSGSFLRVNRSTVTRLVEEAPCSVHVVRPGN
ncbi:MAG: protein kinase [Betaproteobacteria bacterium]|uniref:protein kinase domain-containing protein n=1 Tax=Ferrovum sp. PN-J185 TaxID=1356306 RepID=UPI00079A59F2|nr:protein kinase [Ferrovum sp. PN-J185]KXW56570.1 serine/threonine-protein kinase Pkn1 [Ferrovum sp. PN-J185]MDE1891804.1 protein kinase [Betaproteobacteria bacterium]MDE2056346.1 protein kinase [Betaproteobacteria bacterium]